MLEIYKKGQGVTGRWITALTLLGFAVFGCWALEEMLSGNDWASREFSLGFVNISVSVMVAAVCFIGTAILTGLVINHKRFVDYLINSESELRKVAWPTKDELKRQTIVVIVTLGLFSLLLLAADMLFAHASTLVYSL